MTVHQLNQQNSLLSQYMAELRDVQIQKDRQRFRLNLQRCGALFAYEISKTITYEAIDLTTEYGIAPCNVVQQVPVLGTILRAGMPFHQGFLDAFDNAENAFISTYRHTHKSGEFETKVEYSTIPDVEGKTVIICDPMLATGHSMALAIKEIMSKGKPQNLHIAVLIACDEGISHLKKQFPKATLWVADIDAELTSKSYIVPGLGSVGDLAYGQKY